MKIRYWLMLLVPASVLLGVLTAYLVEGPPPAPVAALVVQQPVLEPRELTLYFAAASGASLESESRQVPGCETELSCLRDTVEALILGPQGGMVPVLPPRTLLRDVSVADGIVTFDFNRDFIDAHPGGSLSELLTVYGLANTVSVNFPHIRQVRILVEGDAVETIKGHVDLRQPLAPDFRYGRAADASGAASPVSGSSETSVAGQSGRKE